MSLFSRIVTRIWNDVVPRVHDVVAKVEEVEEHVEEAAEIAAHTINNATEEIADAVMGSAAARRRVIDSLAADHALHLQETGEDLKYETSIVDLLKLIGEDSSRRFRKELAAEFGIDHYIGSASQNQAMVDEVMKRLSA